MGTWGYGNFDSDAALDMLAVWRRKILDTIRESFTLSSEDVPYSGHGDSRIIANIDILTTLCEHYGTCPTLELEEILEWKQKYVGVYKRFIQNITRREDVEDLTKRLEVIEATFDRFYEVIERLCED